MLTSITMPEESFLLVNLKEDKAKQLAQVISNETSRKILDLLSQKKTATETEIAQALQLPISTVHYNIQNLMEAKLVQANEYHYSPKGKEVNHYSLSNKFVIIAPLEAKEKILDKLKKLLPVAIIVGVVSVGIELFRKGLFFTNSAAMYAPQPLMKTAAPAADVLTAGAQEAVNGTAPGLMSEASRSHAANIILSEPNLTLWFVYGAVFGVIVYLIVDIVKEKM